MVRVTLKSTFPLRCDPDFYFMAKDMIDKDPTLNMRKFTKKISEKKMIIGELFNNKKIEDEVNEKFREMQKSFGF